jgi:hypothetical protein
MGSLRSYWYVERLGEVMRIAAGASFLALFIEHLCVYQYISIQTCVYNITAGLFMSRSRSVFF